MMNHSANQTDHEDVRQASITGNPADGSQTGQEQATANLTASQMTNNPVNFRRPEPPYSKTLRSQFPFLWKICLLYSISYFFLAYRNWDGIGSGIFAGISAGAILLVAGWLKAHPSEEEKFTISIRIENIFYFAAAVLVSFGNCLTDSGFLLFINHVGSFLLFSIACIKLFYNDREWDFGKYAAALLAFWMQILEMIPTPFRDWKYHRRHGEKKLSSTKRYILTGIALGIPILLVTTLLLASADQIFSDLLEKIFNVDRFVNWSLTSFSENMILFPICFVFYILLLYIVFAALCKGGITGHVKKPRQFGTIIAVTVFCMIDVVYILFTGIQFMYLFAGGLPDGYVYAVYARQGFFELLLVALINFVLVLFSNRHFAKSTVLKASMTITCFCTFVMIVSSAYRMYMYIDVYHLTFMRVLVLWFLLLLTFFMAGSTVSIYWEKWNSFRYCLPVLTVLYIAFALSGVHGWIAEYNVAQFEQDWQQNKGTVKNPPSLEGYLPDGYMSSKSYAVALYSLEEQYGEELGKENIELIHDYLQISEHFYTYDFYGTDDEEYGEEDDDEEYDDDDDYVFIKEAAIYDKKIPDSIFMWKHFNFVENACYKRCSGD